MGRVAAASGDDDDDGADAGDDVGADADDGADAGDDGADEPAELTEVSLQLQWVPQSQFAGYFAAVELHPAHAAPENDHLSRIGGQHIVQPIVRAAPDIERVEIGREIRRRRYELERV